MALGKALCNYERTNAFRVPTEGEVGWYVDDEWRAVRKGTILEFAKRRSWGTS